MADFSFDDTKSFAENATAFLASVEAIDKEMADVLSANWQGLLGIVTEGERDAKQRSGFNSVIAEALDELVEQSQASGDK